VIKAAGSGDDGAVSGAEALLVADPRALPDTARVRRLVTEHSGFVWRSLVRLGVPRSDAEDALQQVFLVAAGKLEAIEPGRERAFLFGTAMRIASRARRTRDRRREVLDGEPAEREDPAPGADDLVDRARARAALDAILDEMPLELRAVFVLFEIEQVTMAEIAALLDLPAGTVASRLRRAREHFQAATRRLSARGGLP
jgi:RNA polymerase sigma-70 factor (ECF subfamily)